MLIKTLLSPKGFFPMNAGRPRPSKRRWNFCRVCKYSRTLLIFFEKVMLWKLLWCYYFEYLVDMEDINSLPYKIKSIREGSLKETADWRINKTDKTQLNTVVVRSCSAKLYVTWGASHQIRCIHIRTFFLSSSKVLFPKRPYLPASALFVLGEQVGLCRHLALIVLFLLFTHPLPSYSFYFFARFHCMNLSRTLS